MKLADVLNGIIKVRIVLLTHLTGFSAFYSRLKKALFIDETMEKKSSPDAVTKFN